MKRLNKILAGILSIIFLLPGLAAFSRDGQKGDLSMALNYFVNNNKIPYLTVKVKTKVDGRFKPVGDISLKLYLGADSSGTLIGIVITNENGEASANIPSSLKNQWGKSAKHEFTAVFDGNKQFESSKADLAVTRAKILLDTTADRKITATVMELKDTSWTPVKGVELKIAVKRLGADLPVNETPTFTTDSTGQATADFKRDSLPGGARGMITLIAKVEDNDQYGNLSVEETVPWGAKFIPLNTFDRRTLFATRDKAPVWLLLIACSIVIVVWGIMIYLVAGVFKIKKLGQQAAG